MSTIDTLLEHRTPSVTTVENAAARLNWRMHEVADNLQRQWIVDFGVQYMLTYWLISGKTYIRPLSRVTPAQHNAIVVQITNILRFEGSM